MPLSGRAGAQPVLPCHGALKAIAHGQERSWLQACRSRKAAGRTEAEAQRSCRAFLEACRRNPRHGLPADGTNLL